MRTIPIGAGAGYCAVDANERNLYVTEETVGIWKLAAEPESDTTRELVDLAGARGHLTDEVKGVAISGTMRIPRQVATRGVVVSKH